MCLDAAMFSCCVSADREHNKQKVIRDGVEQRLFHEGKKVFERSMSSDGDARSLLTLRKYFMGHDTGA